MCIPRGNDRFHIVSRWNTLVVFVGHPLKKSKKQRLPDVFRGNRKKNCAENGFIARQQMNLRPKCLLKQGDINNLMKE